MEGEQAKHERHLRNYAHGTEMIRVISDVLYNQLELWAATGKGAKTLGELRDMAKELNEIANRIPYNEP